MFKYTNIRDYGVMKLYSYVKLYYINNMQLKFRN